MHRVVVGALHLLSGGAALRVAVGASVVRPGVLGAQDVLLAVLAPAVPVGGGAADAHLAGQGGTPDGAVRRPEQIAAPRRGDWICAGLEGLLAENSWGGRK
jgi:hypothetical protein